MKLSREKVEIFQARRGMSASELATASGLSISGISNAKLRGSCKPETVGRLAAALGVDPTELLDNIPAPCDSCPIHQPPERESTGNEPAQN